MAERRCSHGENKAGDSQALEKQDQAQGDGLDFRNFFAEM